MMLQNPFASPRSREHYNYEGALLGGLRLGEAAAVVERSCETCPQCEVSKKDHYCIEPSCGSKQLICAQCEVGSIGQPHYLHDHTFVLPLLSRDISNHFYRLKHTLTAYHADILEEVARLQQYLAELTAIAALAKRRVEQLEQEEERSRIKDYLPRMEQFLAASPRPKLSTVLRDVHFKSAQECAAKEEEVRGELVGQLSALKWPKDPVKVLKEKLQKGSQEEERREIFLSARKRLELSEVDGNFRACQQFYTRNLENHRIEVKVENDYLSKHKYYEAFIHHFRNCRHLLIDNATLAHLKTPLAFRRLRSLHLTFNNDLDSPSTRVEQASPELTALTLRRLREEDSKVLKTVASCCPQLRKVHLEFANKIDLFNYKELIDFLEGVGRASLVSFTLKIRTENEVKRLYGYLSKFYKEFSSEGSCNLAEAVGQLLESSPLLTKVVIEGVKPLGMGALLGRLKALPFLMDYKIYYENIDLMTEVEDREAKELEDLCYKRKRLLYSLAKASKEKRYPRAVINRVAEEMLI